MDVIIDAARCNDRVRVFNGFPLCLERDNVFFDDDSDAPAQNKPVRGAAAR